MRRRESNVFASPLKANTCGATATVRQDQMQTFAVRQPVQQPKSAKSAMSAKSAKSAKGQ